MSLRPGAWSWSSRPLHAAHAVQLGISARALPCFELRCIHGESRGPPRETRLSSKPPTRLKLVINILFLGASRILPAACCGNCALFCFPVGPWNLCALSGLRFQQQAKQENFIPLQQCLHFTFGLDVPRVPTSRIMGPQRSRQLCYSRGSRVPAGNVSLKPKLDASATPWVLPSQCSAELTNKLEAACTHSLCANMLQSCPASCPNSPVDAQEVPPTRCARSSRRQQAFAFRE